MFERLMASPLRLKVLLLAVVLSLILGCDTTPAGREIAAQTASAASLANTTFAQQAQRLCPLGRAEVWLRPFSGMDVAMVSGAKALDGEKREYSVKATYWCRGEARQGHTSPVEGVAVAHAVANAGQSVVSLSEWKNEELGDVSLLLELAYFLGPTLLAGVVLVYVAAGDIWIWLATDLWWLVIVRWLISIPALAVPVLLIAGLGGAGWWAYQVFHSSVGVLLSPLLSLPVINLVIRLYLKQMAAS
jgi:hypothetical protein